MDAPECFKCGKQHWSRERCPADKAVREDNLTVRHEVSPSVRQTVSLCKECELHLKRIAELEAELARLQRQPFDKKTYQREYMRRRRAKRLPDTQAQ